LSFRNLSHPRHLLTVHFIRTTRNIPRANHILTLNEYSIMDEFISSDIFASVGEQITPLTGSSDELELLVDSQDFWGSQQVGWCVVA
jgi:hypothetical protein